MKRIIQGLLAALTMFSYASATTHSNKTFLTPRSDNVNMAMEYTTWHKQTALIDKHKFGGTIQAVGFYQESTNKGDLGKYFGIQSCGCDGSRDYITVYPQHLSGQSDDYWASGHILHTYGITPLSPRLETLADRIVWHPKRTAYGLRLDYHQKLDKLVKGLFFKIALPIEHVKTTLGFTSTCCTTTCCATSCCPTDCNKSCCDTSCATNCCPSAGYCRKQGLQDNTETLNGSQKSLAEYLSGCVSNDYSHAKQVALCKAKIHNGNTETAIADIDFVLGYNLLYKPTRHVNLNVAVTIPTGNTPDAEYLWEAIVGNHGHWALGFGLDSAFQLWQEKDKSLDFLLAFNYRYLFSDTEKRTAGFVFPCKTDFGTRSGKKAPYGHWILAGKVGDKCATPFANFLTRDMKVTPGSQFDGIAQLAFNYEGWTFDLGYNLFAREEESVKLKDCWCDNTYGIAAPTTWDTNVEFAIANAWGAVAINTCDLDLNDCKTPSIFTNKIYGGIGYAFKKWEYPLMLGIGASYEWGSDNAAIDQWALYGKIGLTF